MKRRHLFDHGYPVTSGTRIAGGLVLLAVSNEALRTSRDRLALSFMRLADTSQRVLDSAERTDCTKIELHASHAQYAKLLRYVEYHRSRTAVEATIGLEPADHAACAQPHKG